MKKNIFIGFSLILSSLAFAEMKLESQEEKEKCLGMKAKSPQYHLIYDALSMLIKDKNCYISNIVVLPGEKEKKEKKALAPYRPECKIKFGNTSPEVILQFEIDKNKLNKDSSFLKKTVAFVSQSVLQLPADTKEVPTEFKFRRGKSDVLKNPDDYYFGNKEEGEKGLRELAVEAGVCNPAEQEPLTEPNQPAFVQSNSSSSSTKGHQN